VKTRFFCRVKAEELDRRGALNKADKLPLGPAPLDEEWLPKAAVMILVDLMVVICSRPKGMFKDCYIRINAGIDRAKGAIPVLSCVNVSIVLLMILKLWELGNEGVLPWYTILLKFHCFPSFVQ